jgi:hypothetical protein
MRLLLVGLIVASLASQAQAAGSSAAFTIEARVRGTRVEGKPLSWNEQQIFLLARDGFLWEFRPDEASGLRKTAGSFHSYSFPELRGALERELEGRLELTSTAHYLVAHPRGAGRKWAERFEELYRSFVHYFAVRGLAIKDPEFPLVALVWPSKEEFGRYARTLGTEVPPGMLGFYSPVSNRVLLYDSSSGKNDTLAWQQDAATSVHEATHQTAFNTGVHSRFAPPPRWLAEGLGMLFESRGVHNSRNYPNAEDRINRNRLAEFRQYVAAGRKPGAFLEIVESDRLFQINPSAAYAEAWALAWFLSETQPTNYSRYLSKTAGRESFVPYTAAQRRADFTAAFGSDLRMLEASYLRFVEQRGGKP